MKDGSRLQAHGWLEKDEKRKTIKKKRGNDELKKEREGEFCEMTSDGYV